MTDRENNAIAFPNRCSTLPCTNGTVNIPQKWDKSLAFKPRLSAVKPNVSEYRNDNNKTRTIKLGMATRLAMLVKIVIGKYQSAIQPFRIKFCTVLIIKVNGSLIPVQNLPIHPWVT